MSKQLFYTHQPMKTSKPKTTPCEQNINSYDEATHQTYNNHQYRQMVGSLIYAMNCTRPDLSFVVTKLSQNLSCPDPGDCAMIKHVFQYINKTVDHKLTFRKSSTPLRVHAFSDADWATSVEDRRSVTGYSISLNPEGPAVSWKSKKQSSVVYQ
ncbi:uncharacterized protein [Clytia hemisphaerica]|uniref:uncharacterized protein n=1 Tax=Clytia hemisphaerica TaxID=252671 RepID=UPI0034D5C00D